MNTEPARLIIVSGLSGSGISTALHALEDHGYFCIDNLPVPLVAPLLERLRTHPGEYPLIAVGLDVRSRRTPALPEILDRIAGTDSIDMRLLFLTASDEVLIQRYNTTRRRHPLTVSEGLPEAISQERRLLDAISDYASDIIDSSTLNVHELRSRVVAFAGAEQNPPQLEVQSFSFSHGLPMDLDFMFDARCLPNPHWDTSLRSGTGRDEKVREFLSRSELVNRYLDHITAWLQEWLPQFQQPPRSRVTIGIGCTGGRHRSVFVAEALVSRLSEQFPNIRVRHRDIG